ncbi:MAG: TolC family protein [Rhodocyclaceae bacterium]|nr:TolC family protein [Rhodocyclaceae bacterium]
MKLIQAVPFVVACLTAAPVYAEVPTPNLPPDDIVRKVLLEHPGVQAASTQVRLEEANRDRLEAGPYEWTVRYGQQQRRTYPAAADAQRFHEWNATLERAVRLPGKASLDAEIGAKGIEIAETALGDTRHETSRALLHAWFIWLRESAAVRQWELQLASLEKQGSSVRRRQQLGDAARLESVLAEAALAQAKTQLSQARLRRQSAEEELRRRYPGLPLPHVQDISEPMPTEGGLDLWLGKIITASHEVQLARAQVQRARLAAERAASDRVPDPTIGVSSSRERAGEERLVGVFVSIPLPGQARRATSDAASAQLDWAMRQEESARRKTQAEAAVLYQSVMAARESWQSSRDSADQMEQAASMTARAYQLGEGSLNELLMARRLANEAQLAERQMRLDALEYRYRLLLDAHQIWDFDE